MINVSKSPRGLLSRLAPLALLLLASANLYAQQPMSFSLKGESEVPSVTTSAMGIGQIMVLPDHTVSGSIKTIGFVPTMAHIHEAATGKNGPPIITLTKTANDNFAVPPDAKLTEAQYVSYKAGNLYVNVHSAQHPNGEMRAQLLRVVSNAPLGQSNEGVVMKGFVKDIEDIAVKNNEFRRVLYTAKNCQLVVMALKPKEEIGAEVHKPDQFFRVEEGSGEAVLDGVRTPIRAGFAVVVPGGTTHNIINTGSVPLKLYTIYAPPNHRDGVVHHTRADAAADNERFDGKTTE